MNSYREAIECGNVSRPRVWMQLTEVSSSMRRIDILVLALILGVGALQFYFCERAGDFLYDDVFFADAGRSLVDHGFYGINGYPETNQPPGLPWILGLLCLVGGCGHVVFLRTMAVFGTLAFLVTYELLRRQAPRLVAASICLLLISSPKLFLLATQWVFPSYPYFFASMAALLVARKFEQATHPTAQIGWGALLTAFIVASLMFASAAMAFLGAMVAIVGVVFFRDRTLAFTRLRTYFAVFLVGILVQGLWMHKSVEASSGISAQEWPVEGFPHSYVAQLKLKAGNYPELGMATPRDIPVRILKNAYERANLLSQILLRRHIYVAWMSIATVGMLFLVALGWCYSVWRTGGGLQEWYFAGYEFIYVLWPWDLEPRFFLPVAPLACLYVWRAGKAIFFLARKQPRLLGAVWLPVAVLLTASAWFWVRGSGIGKQLPHAGLQDETSFVVWLLSALLAAWMIWAGTDWFTPVSAFLRGWLRPIGSLPINRLRISQVAGIVLVAGFVVMGLATQVKISEANVDLNSKTNRLPPEVEAGLWIRTHTDPDAVVMARHVPIVYHYSNRKVIWFPPSSNPQLLMEGIRRHQVNYVVVVERQNSYYLPPDDTCFAPLLTAYPDAFHLAYQIPQCRIFSVVGIASSMVPAVGIK
jgi:4-amino-4-deoxy-L-arabinose transferase-like glycosyltransferase